MTLSRLLYWGGAVVGLLGSVVWLGYRWEPVLENLAIQWTKHKALQYYVSHVAPGLPFQVDNFAVDATWEEIKKGRVSRFRATLAHPLGRLHVDSPLEVSALHGPAPQYLFHLKPRLNLERTQCDPLELDIQVLTPQSLQKIDSLSIRATVAHWNCPALHLATQEVSLAAQFASQSLSGSIFLSSLDWSPKPTQVVHATQVQWQASASLDSNEIITTAQIDHAEVLWNENYGDLNLKPFPLNARLKLNPKRNVVQEATLHFPLLDAVWTPKKLRWKSSALNVKDLVGTLYENLGKGTGWFAKASPLQDYEWTAGTLQSEGTLNLGKSSLSALNTRTQIKAASVDSKKAALAFQGANLTFESNGQNFEVETSIQNFQVFKFSGSLGPWTLIGRNGQIESTAPIPLTTQGLRLSLGKVLGHYDAIQNHYALQTSAELEETPLEAFLSPLCYDSARIPPAQIRASFPSIEVKNDHIRIKGDANISLWGGKIQFSDLSAQHLDTEIPEFNFSTNFSGIELLPLGTWLNFGEMKGILQGYARHVVIQKWLPTHFDFRIDALPHRNWIEFSPESLKNLIGLFAGDAVEQIPGFAHDPFFGWMSDRLGGFDLKYAGLSLFADNGTILIETHDPPEIYRILKKHYIFWGRRFKMPLITSTYPVAMDQMGLTRVALVMADQIKALAEKKKAEKNEVHETESSFLSPTKCTSPLVSPHH